MNKTVFRQIISSMAEEAFPTRMDAWNILSNRFEKKSENVFFISEKRKNRRSPSLIGAGLTLVILLFLIGLFLTPQIRIITLDFLRFFNPVATQTRPVQFTSTSNLFHEETVDANHFSVIARVIATPDYATGSNQYLELNEVEHSKPSMKLLHSLNSHNLYEYLKRSSTPPAEYQQISAFDIPQ